MIQLEKIEGNFESLKDARLFIERTIEKDGEFMGIKSPTVNIVNLGIFISNGKESIQLKQIINL